MREIGPDAAGLKCLQGHDLSAHVGGVQEYVGNPRCDLCQTEDLNEHDNFYRCAECGFDCCAHCAAIICHEDVNEYLEQEEEEEEEEDGW